MKRTFTIVILLGFLFSILSGLAQEQKRTRTIGMEKYRDLIENYDPSQQLPSPARNVGVLIYSENFDGTGGNLPEDWTSGGSSTSCVWAVDASPNPPGYYSAGYSLNYNNGVDFNCGDNWGWVRSGLINVGGQTFDINFQFISYNECGINGNCAYDQTYITVYDDSDSPIYYELVNAYVIGNPGWTEVNLTVDNIAGANFIRIEFYFDTYDGAFNNYQGPFVDDLEVYGTAVTPISGWALGIGIFLIIGFAIFRIRKFV